MKLTLLVLTLIINTLEPASGSPDSACRSAGSGNGYQCQGQCDKCSSPRHLRPHFRSALARSVYNRMLQDHDFETFNKQQWYGVNLELVTPSIRCKFVQLDAEDEETQRFLNQCHEKSDAVLTQLWHLVAKTIMSPFVAQTSINGLLGRGSMFVVSARQFRRLFNLSDDFQADSLLDLGAGDGATTSLIAPMFRHVHVTEVSWPMKRILNSKGFTVEPVESWDAGGRTYDVICALNLLDRCSKPLTLLRQIAAALRPSGGRLLVALVWPFQPYVEMAADHRPEEPLPIKGETLEEQVSSLIHGVLEPLDLHVVGWSRVPYLCEGDLERTFYYLSDIVVALERRR